MEEVRGCGDETKAAPREAGPLGSSMVSSMESSMESSAVSSGVGQNGPSRPPGSQRTSLSMPAASRTSYAVRSAANFRKRSESTLA
jgi:hypothetical protein